ncbi:hypothetical protein MAPG_05403 [Magnaporthiopsis poae ATCC 64411]|uniref:Uncharacterized protein n=1 Tax=Magnaporthiopsis poae (strain ATCC 64411 / 73-15) TaxID=644358 RepID=A0A0C4DZA8_MAGP6|nr:hypothetical protein MAPG_05403 [Magnaporthiopsis poae ATCC 64411]
MHVDAPCNPFGFSFCFPSLPFGFVLISLGLWTHSLSRPHPAGAAKSDHFRGYHLISSPPAAARLPAGRGPFWRPAHTWKMTSPFSLYFISSYLTLHPVPTIIVFFLFVCCYVGHSGGDPVESYVPRAGSLSGGRRFSSPSFASPQTIVHMGSLAPLCVRRQRPLCCRFFFPVGITVVARGVLFPLPAGKHLARGSTARPAWITRDVEDW